MKVARKVMMARKKRFAQAPSVLGLGNSQKDIGLYILTLR
jgi:hypothetical protein